MQPVWHNSVLIHQVANAFQHCLEVVLLHQKQRRLAPGGVKPGHLQKLHVGSTRSHARPSKCRVCAG